MPDPWTHHTARVNGFRMHYVTAGSGLSARFPARLATDLVRNGVKSFQPWLSVLLLSHLIYVASATATGQ